MLPHQVAICAPVSDLEDIGDLEGYIARSKQVLVFASQGYFQSKNCMREIRSSVARGVPLLALLEPDPAKGLKEHTIKEQLLVGWRDEHGLHEVAASYAAWGFKGGPSRDELVAALFAREPIEWNRIGESRRCDLPLS